MSKRKTEKTVVKREFPEESSFSCPYCPSAFTREYVLKQHITRRHSHLPILHRCNVCNDKFVEFTDLLDHRASHELEAAGGFSKHKSALNKTVRIFRSVHGKCCVGYLITLLQSTFVFCFLRRCVRKF